MSDFTDAELAYLASARLLGRIATVGPGGMPHVAPVGWSLVEDGTVVEITGRNFAATQKYRDVQRTHRAAIVIDDVLPPWRPRGIEVRGRAEAIDGSNPRIRIRPERIVAWGIEPDGGRSARTIARTG